MADSRDFFSLIAVFVVRSFNFFVFVRNTCWEGVGNNDFTKTFAKSKTGYEMVGQTRGDSAHLKQAGLLFSSRLDHL